VQRQEKPADQTGDTEGARAPEARPKSSASTQTTDLDDEKLGEIAELM
jgi:hypothetical protein